MSAEPTSIADAIIICVALIANAVVAIYLIRGSRRRGK